ncbi:MAG TPA: hypothetical protein VK249_27980 [Anaerolineales bacterium]|nr:hypothetical protein [Anaerolineales bacterium]
MSRRKRHQDKGTEIGDIEWFKHRTGYPTPEERDEIIRLRNQLSSELISLMAMEIAPDDPRSRALIKKYGQEEFLRAQKVVQESIDMPSRVADDVKSYRDYRLRFARFGAGLPFYTARELEELYGQHLEQFLETMSGENIGATGDPAETDRLLLSDWREWEDITPPAVPSRPDDYDAPQPASYSMPIAELLEWGNDLNRQHEFADEQEYLQWKKLIPALTRMALDPGLLNGWPSENASWAPWHAIHALGILQAWESAPALAALADFENDWLSDHLPDIWADMGIEAEPVLWMILEDHSASAKRRGLAAEALYTMTDEIEVLHNKVVRGFEKTLQNTKTFDPALNGYLILFLKDMEAIEDTYMTVSEAFEQNRVDLDFITPDDLMDDDLDDGEEFD